MEFIVNFIEKSEDGLQFYGFEELGSQVIIMESEECWWIRSVEKGESPTFVFDIFDVYSGNPVKVLTDPSLIKLFGDKGCFGRVFCKIDKHYFPTVWNWSLDSHGKVGSDPEITRYYQDTLMNALPEVVVEIQAGLL